MCLAIPGKIVSFDRSLPGLTMASVDFGGLTRKICVQWVEAAEGDYIMAHAGMAISRVDADEARQTLAAFESIALSIANKDEKP